MIDCQKAAKEGYNQANDSLKEIKQSIESAQKQLSDGLKKMKKTGTVQLDTLNKVKEQLETVKKNFNQSYDETKAKLDEKFNKKESFNIVLFGRTMCGKSTLMEILKHGQGESIGKGAQRTTRDIREYEWNGLTITDVPGIDAFDGKDDDTLAEEAADKADLIIFMITAGQPEASEAKWLVKLKRKDKPILCLCNYKQAIEGNEHNLKRFLKTAEGNMQSEQVKELIEQFKNFVQENLPGEHIEVFIAHLNSMYLSRKKEYAAISDELQKLSRFSFFENAIINYVARYGVFNRKRSFLAVVDNPVYRQYLHLLDFSRNNYLESCHVFDAITTFDSWITGFESDSVTEIANCIDNRCNDIRNCVSSFVEDHLEDENIEQLWKNRINSFHIEKTINNKINAIGAEAQRKIDSIFSNLDAAINITIDLSKNTELSDQGFTNWKKINGWVSAGAGAIGAILLFMSNPVGWIFSGIGVLFGVFTWFNDSREKKLHEARQELTKSLNKNIDKLNKELKSKAVKEFKKSLKQTNNDTKFRLNMMWHTLVALANSQREMGWNFCNQHCEISKVMTIEVLKEIGLHESETKKITGVARIPSIKNVMLTSDLIDIKKSDIEQKTTNNLFSIMQKTLGNSESVSSIVKFDKNRPLYNQLNYLLTKYGIDLGVIKIVKINKDIKYPHVAYYKPKNLTQQERNSLDLIQQILKVQLIQRSSL